MSEVTERPAVYLETSVIGYATSRVSRDLVAAARQRITREWFAGDAAGFELFISRIVVDEISAGDATAAADRLEFVRGWPLLAVNDAAIDLAADLIGRGAIPATRQADALHIAVAAVAGVEHLLTWNFKHIANVATRQAIERVCRASGYTPPWICTPEELSRADTG